MKGTDCTPEQVEHASQFLADRGWKASMVRGANRREDIVRVIAWYGALRYQAAKSGVGGTLEQPGELVTAEKGGDKS